MLTKEQNELLCRVEGGAPMGQLARRHWLPVCMAEEVPESDGKPVRARLLGEDLVVFRDSDGRLGVLGEHCLHRRASLAFGRNEDCGLRCLYHGWKFDVEGNVVDMPSEAPGAAQRLGKKAKAYPAVEKAGVVWVYMGSRAVPKLPAFEILDMPADEIRVQFVLRECNYLQAVEGELDTSHFGFLHAGHVDPDQLADDDCRRDDHAQDR